MPRHSHSGFEDRTPLAEASETLSDLVDFHGRRTEIPIEDADGRALAAPLTADRNVPHYQRAAMDGFAVRAADTVGAGERSPIVLRRSDDEVGAGEATPVHTGSELPAGADSVVMIEAVDELGDDVEVFEAVAEGANVAPVGEDVERGRQLYDAGDRVGPSDLGMLKLVGHSEVPVRERPTVAVIPTGEELVQSDPAPGETVETNGLVVSGLARRWGASATYAETVTDDEAALERAISTATDHDIVVTTGGSSVGERDLLPAILSDLGSVHVHGVGLEPGHPVAIGAVDDTPVLALPGYPVSCLVTAVQFLRPAIKRAGGFPIESPPTVEARLDGKLHSTPGIRTFARVALTNEDGERVAMPVRSGGAGVFSSVAAADGWVAVADESEGIPSGESVAVEDWEWSP